MSALTSLLVRDGVVPVRKIEDALQRQVISGGDVETVLLEMDALPENVLAAYRAALHDLAPATREEVMAVPPEIVRVVPAEVAFEHRLIPLALSGSRLEVAVREPLSPEQAERLGFLLGYEIVPRIACEVRIAAGLAHHFGAELPPRFVRLLDRLRKRDSGVAPAVAPRASARLAAHASEIPYKGEPAAPFEGRTRPIVPLSIETSGSEPRPRRSTARGLGVVSEDPELAEAAEREREARRSRSSEPRRTPVASIPDDDEDEPNEGPVVFPSSGRERAVVARPAQPPPPPSVPPPSLPPVPASEVRRSPSQPGMRLLRGPLTLAGGERLLKQAADRDQILEITFSFARQFFDYTAMFVVHDNVADGREAWGVGATTEEVAALEIPLDRPSVFAEARRSLAPQVRKLEGAETDRALAQALHRAVGTTSLVMPIAIRQRVVVLLYGDRDGEEFDLGAVMELVRFASRVAEAFELLIIRKKRVGYHGETERPSPRGALKQAAQAVAETAGRARPDPRARDSGAWKPGRRSGALVVEPAHDEDRWSSDEPAAMARAEREQRETIAMPRAAAETPEAAASRDAGHEVAFAPTPPAVDAPPQAVLGIPRDAPPPPPAAALDLGAPELDEVIASLATEVSAPVQLESDEHEEAEPEIVVDAEDDDDDDVEVEIVDEPEEDEPVLRDGRPRRPGTYRLRSAPVDVVRPGIGAEAPRRTGTRARARPPRDPRREEDEEGVAHELVRRAALRHPPPPPAEPETRTVIVDMGEQVHEQVEDLLRATDDATRNELIRGLLYLGEAALPALVQAFPGPLFYDRARTSGPPPAGRDVSVVARALVAFGERAVPYVASLLGSERDDTRFYAALVASELVHPELTDAVAERIYDPDPAVRRIACALLPRFAGYRAFDEVRVTTRRTARLRGKDLSRRWYAVDAIAALRDVEVIDKLIELFKEEDDETLAEHVHRALVILSATDLGRSQRRWLAWYEKHRAQHRVEWLIEGLLHGDEKIRALAGAELERLTLESYGYHAGSPRRERERVHRLYRRWWEAEGQRRFA